MSLLKLKEFIDSNLIGKHVKIIILTSEFVCYLYTEHSVQITNTVYHDYYIPVLEIYHDDGNKLEIINPDTIKFLY